MSRAETKPERLMMRFEEVAKPIARRFCVSPQAMRLRLEKLGLLLRQAPQQASLTVDP
jgi:Zn-dependent peptidase ImmA (M78 family)